MTNPSKISRTAIIASCLTVLLAMTLANPGVAQRDRSQSARIEALEITAEVIAFDKKTRAIALAGPLGGAIIGVVSDEVEDISKIEVGSMVSATYYQALAVAASREGETEALFKAGDIKGKKGDAASVNEVVTVSAVDVENHNLVVETKSGDLIATDVARPEFIEKLKDLEPGDKLDITYSEALVTDLRLAKPGEEADVVMKVGTLVIDNGEILNRSGHTLLVRNESGRVIKAVVDPDFKFSLNGKEATVYDLEKGMKLTRTAIRVQEVSYSGS